MGTWFVVGILLLCVAAAIRSMLRRKQSGKSLHCGGDCSRCMGECNKKRKGIFSQRDLL